MPLSNNISTYNDVKVVLDTALERGGGRYRLPSEGAARHFIQRAYKYRQLRLQLEDRGLLVPGIAASTPYDHLILRLEGNEVAISERAPEGTFFDPQGEEVSLSLMDDETEALLNELVGGGDDHVE